MFLNIPEDNLSLLDEAILNHSKSEISLQVAFLIDETKGFQIMEITCPFTQPPAMRCGYLGLNWRHVISSGASKNSWIIVKTKEGKT